MMAGCVHRRNLLLYRTYIARFYLICPPFPSADTHTTKDKDNWILDDKPSLWCLSPVIAVECIDAFSFSNFFQLKSFQWHILNIIKPPYCTKKPEGHKHLKYLPYDQVLAFLRLLFHYFNFYLSNTCFVW